MKFLKAMLILTAVISLSACTQNTPPQTDISTEPVKTETEITSVQQLTIYDKYPQLSQYDIFSKYYERAEEIVNSMTTQEKIGQMFWISCPEDEETAKEYINSYKLGGYILFSSHFSNATPYSIQNKINSFQENSDFKMAIVCNEEGGDVVSISNHIMFRPAPFCSPQTLYYIGGINEIVKETHEKSEFLKNLGINVNLAPVANVSVSSYDSIYSRSLGKMANETGEYVKSSVRAYSGSGITCVMKYFPSYTSGDDNREYEEFISCDFVPFLEGIKADAPCIMVNHDKVSVMDSDNPAVLSPEIHNILRNKLGFSGLIITDDLKVTIENNEINEVDACLKAIESGNDIICTSVYEEGIPAVVKASETGKISEQKINTSVIRIIAWKLSYGIIE